MAEPVASHLEQRPPSPPDPGNGTVLALGIEVQRLTAILLEPVDNHYRLAAWWIAPSRVHRPATGQIQDICEQMGTRIRRRLWDETSGAPFTQSGAPVRYPPVEQVVISASPRPRLRVWVVGLTSHNSLAAAQHALGASQAQIMGTTALEAGVDTHSWVRELNSTRPEALVLAGGYDSSESHSHHSLLRLSRHVLAALNELPDEAVPDIVYAGSALAYQDVASVLRRDSRLSVVQVNNVMPSSGKVQVQPLAQTIDELYWQKCRRMRGFNELEKWSAPPSPIMTIESSFARLIQLWLQLNEMPHVHGVYTNRDRWYHVWADGRTDEIMAQYTAPGEHPDRRGWWPPLDLVSGPWDVDSGLPDSVVWWDRNGLAPVAAACARTAPRAAVESIRADLLVRRER